ncbi:unnamed protein product [Amoebophrya sp. A120]|nr:unnamed protein product [Amoebophrya sp. A120]|eukprot:GSA120T00010561001.1
MFSHLDNLAGHVDLQKLQLGFAEVLKVTLGSLLITIVLELLSYRTVRKVPKDLYKTAVLYNVINVLFLAPLSFLYVMYNMVMVNYECNFSSSTGGGRSPILDNVFSLNADDFAAAKNFWLDMSVSYCKNSGTVYSVTRNIVGILVIQAFGYYTAHRLMHTRRLYWMHSFHHKFHNDVVPMAANAVSPAEYLFAYLLPILVGTVVVNPAPVELLTAGWMISLTNLLIHFPLLESFSEAYFPEIFVSAFKHGEHHRKVSVNFAAPIFDVDWFLYDLLKLPIFPDKKRQYYLELATAAKRKKTEADGEDTRTFEPPPIGDGSAAVSQSTNITSPVE